MIKYDRSVFLILVSDHQPLSPPSLCPKNEAFSLALNVWKWLQMIGLLDGSWGPSGGLPATPESCDSGLGDRQTFVYTESNLFMIVFLNANLLALWRNSTVCWPSRQILFSFVLIPPKPIHRTNKGDSRSASDQHWLSLVMFQKTPCLFPTSNNPYNNLSVWLLFGFLPNYHCHTGIGPTTTQVLRCPSRCQF